MRFVLLITVLGFCINAYSQNNTYTSFRHISVSDGLSQSTVIAITQDKLGQIWIGTRDGLNKFDGDKITVFRNTLSGNSITNNDVIEVIEDSDGNIWTGTYNGLSKFDPYHETFDNYLYTSQNSSITHLSIRTIKEVTDSTLLIGTSDGLFTYDKNNNQVIRDKLLFPDSESFHIYDILKENDDLWFGTS